MERNQGTLQEAIEKAVDFINNRTDDTHRKLPYDRQSEWNTTHDKHPMIYLNRESTGASEKDYTQATVLSKDQLDWLIVGGSYLFFAIICCIGMVCITKMLGTWCYHCRRVEIYPASNLPAGTILSSVKGSTWARNNSAIPIMSVLDPDLASETKPISQYENFNYGGSCRQSTAKDSMLPGGSIVDLSRPVKVPMEMNSHCITCPTITERISERSNFDLLIDAESLPNENHLSENLDSVSIMSEKYFSEVNLIIRS